MSFWMTLFSYQIQILMEKIKAILQQNPDRNKKGKSTILVFYYHPQNKKNENRPTADEETLEDSSDTYDNSPSKPLCPPGAQDAEASTVTRGKALAEQSFVQGSNIQRWSPLDRPKYADVDD